MFSRAQVKLNDIQVYEIRFLSLSGVSKETLAELYHVSDNTILKVISDESYGKTIRKSGIFGAPPKLDNEQVIKIRALYSSGEATVGELAYQFKIGGSQISNIVSNRCWFDPNYKPLSRKEILERRKQRLNE